MPNWCHSVWKFVGDKDDLDAIESMKMDFNKIKPMPEILRCTLDKPDSEMDKLDEEHGLRAKTGHKSWYDWQSNNWGTKWGSCHISSEGPPAIRRTSDTVLVCLLRNPWGLPGGIINTLRFMYPNVMIRIDAMDDVNDVGQIMVVRGDFVEMSENNVCFEEWWDNHVDVYRLEVGT